MMMTGVGNCNELDIKQSMSRNQPFQFLFGMFMSAAAAHRLLIHTANKIGLCISYDFLHFSARRWALWYIPDG